MSDYVETLLYLALTGTAIIAILWIGVKDKYLLFPISFFAVLLLLTPAIANAPHLVWFKYAGWIISAIGLCAFYYLRTVRKVKLRTIDYVKISAVIFYSVYLVPVSLLSLEPVFQDIIAYAAIGYAGIVYAIDRLGLYDVNESNRKYIIIIAIQSILVVGFFFYGLIRQFQAEQQRSVADQERRDAEKERDKVYELLDPCRSRK